MAFSFEHQCKRCGKNFNTHNHTSNLCQSCHKTIYHTIQIKSQKTREQHKAEKPPKRMQQAQRVSNLERDNTLDKKLRDQISPMNEMELSYKMKMEFGDPERRFVLMPFVIEDCERAIMVDGKRVGAVDFIVRHYRKRYALEIKSAPNGRNCFWAATKVLAYTIMLNHEEGMNTYHPAALLPKATISPRTLKLGGFLGIRIFSFEYDPHADKVFIDTEELFC